MENTENEEKKIDSAVVGHDSNKKTDENPSVSIEKVDNNKSEIDGDDISLMEVVDKSDKKKVALDSATQSFVEKNKEKIDKIDWDSIIYEDEEKTIPLVSKDDIEVYGAITSEFVGDMDLESWIRMSKEEIAEYNELIKNKEELDEVDQKYAESLKDTAQSSKELLALLQTQAKDLRKEFVDNKVAETAIKAAVIKTLRDFISERYPLSSDLKKTMYPYYDNLISKVMYVVPIFKQSVERDFKRLTEEKDKDLIRFSKSRLDSDTFDFSVSISTYVKMLGKQDNIDLSAIIAKDFDFMNFFVVTILYSVYKFGDKDFVLKNIKNIDEETIKNLDLTMNPDDTVSDYYKAISDKVFKIINLLTKENIKKILDMIKNALDTDKNIKFYAKTNTDYEDIFKEIIKNIPQIVDNKLGAWNSYYRSIRKLNLYLMFNDLYKLSDSNVDEFKAGAFNIIIKYMKYVYEHHFTNFISSFQDYLKFDVNSKESREIFFKTCVNTLNVLHSFGFKSSYSLAEENYKAPKIYELAKSKMGSHYDTTIVFEDDDIILKDVDLREVKKEYSKVVSTALDEFEASIKML